MYKMNRWKKEYKIESQADTYIERRFEEATRFLNNGYHILNEWRCRKSKYISYTDKTIFDFQHYSKHDASHSVNILEAIELILGRKRIKKLSAGDLWLLLESAYFHDIGMSLSYDDLVELWKDEEFKDYINNCLSVWELDYKEAANWYVQMDNLIHNRNQMENIENENELEFSDGWPVELERRILFLVADYVRKDHAKRSQLFLARFQGDISGVIPKRLYQVVTQISIAHGADFCYIAETLKEEQKGFGIDMVHPRFVASLLRLGDLLDMDNNRFDLRAIEHFGKLPWSSELHLKKHKAMKHILITSDKIEAEAESDEFDVCRITNDWFRYIKEEVTNLIAHWNEVAPKELGGCIMQQAKCVVYHPKYPTQFNVELQKKFEVDKVKLTELLIGTNIYDIKLDFLREYIQNAMDATKMKIWLELKDDKYSSEINGKIFNKDELAPFDISQKIYDQYAIKIYIDVDIKNQEIILKIQDQGIGMEADCIKSISKIGSGWRTRKDYQKHISKMLPWLRPTGGFGIGIQSAFMVTDTVEVITKSEYESYGHKVTLNSPRTTGEIFEENGDMTYPRGTSIKINLPLKYFQNWNSEYYERSMRKNYIKTSNKKTGDKKTEDRKNSVQELLGDLKSDIKDVFDPDETLNYVIQFLKLYLQNIICNPIVPIYIYKKNKKVREYKSEYMGCMDYWTQLNRYIELEMTDGDWDYRCIYDKVLNAMMLWNQTESVYTFLQLKKEPKHILGFKNVCVVRDTDYDLPYARRFTVCIDFMGHSADKTLKVHRNAFNESFPVGKYLESNVRIFFKCMWEFSKKDLNSDILSRIKHNIWSYPMVFIKKLYFDDINLDQGIGEIQEDIQIINCDIQGINNENGDLVDTEISFHKKSVSLKDKIDMILSFLDESRDKVLFVGDYSSEVAGLSPTRAMVLAWLKNQDKDETERQKLHKDEGLYALDKLQENDYCIIDDKELATLFISSGKFDVRSIVFSWAASDVKNMSFIMLSWKKEIDKSKEDEKKFIEQIYGKGSGKRYVADMSKVTVEEQYQALLVSKIPFYYDPLAEGPFLISPVDEEIRTNVDLKKIEVDKYDNFLKAIIESAGYAALLNWVYENQVEEKKYKVNEINEAYQNLIKDIYRNLNTMKSAVK